MKSFALIVFLIGFPSFLYAASSTPAAPALSDLWIMPQPWQENGRLLKDMVSHPDEWASTRAQIQGVGYWPWLMNVEFSDTELHDLFSKLAEWHKGFGFEVPVLKAPNWGAPYPLQAQSAFDHLQQFAKKYKAQGMARVDWFAFDEPIFAARAVIAAKDIPAVAPLNLKLMGAVGKDPEAARRIAYGVSETVSYMALMRGAYPDAQLQLIEPYPALTFDELQTAIIGIQQECALRGVKPLDFLRLDLDWNRLEQEKGSWAEVKKIETMCHENGVKFSLIYWASDWPRLQPAGLATPLTWSKGVLHEAQAYFAAGGNPDQMVIESWIQTPTRSVPETEPDTFTASVLDFLGFYSHALSQN